MKIALTYFYRSIVCMFFLAFNSAAALSAPSLGITVAASQNPLIEQSSGQSYKVTLTVTGAPTTSPILFDATMPPGITRTGGISISSGQITGCSPSQLSTLSGCSLASPLAAGVYTLTIPIAVNGTNSFVGGLLKVQVFSQGTNCMQPVPANSPCAATTGPISVLRRAELIVSTTNSHSPFVVAKAGQFFTIDINVISQPSVPLATTITSVLPPWLVTNGAVTLLPGSTSATLTGCPTAAGEHTLSNSCVLTTTTNGIYKVKVPVNVVPAPSVSAISVQILNVLLSNCTAVNAFNCFSNQPLGTVLGAIDDTSSAVEQTRATYNVKTNDMLAFPGSVTYSLTATQPISTCVNPSINPYGVATFTAPAAATSCTVVYQVCAGPVCSAATLTVNGLSPRASIVATKSASPAAFVMTKPGQSYSISITVTNGPTTSPTLITDSFPPGISTNGVITSLNAVDSINCSVALGSTSLGNNCSLPAGLVNGVHGIKIPVEVALGTSLASNNSAAISNLTALCGGANSCLATSAVIETLKANNDSISTIANTLGRVNAASNDKVPSAGSFALSSSAGTCLNPAVVSSGVFSYTAPAVASTCTVNYQLCVLSSCDIATITVTGVSGISISKTASQTPFVANQTGQFYTLTVIVTGGATTAPISIIDNLPYGILTSGAVTAVGAQITGCPVTAGSQSMGACSLNSPLAAGTYSVKIPVTVGLNAITSDSDARIQGIDTNCTAANSLTNPACYSNFIGADVLRAVDDLAIGVGASAGLIDVATNDRYPANSTFQLGTNSSCAATSFSITSTGKVSYTLPTAGTSCIVNYKVCVQLNCAQANLTLKSNAPAPTKIKLSVVSSQIPLVALASGQYYSVDFTITDGPTTAPLQIFDFLPTGISLLGPVTSTAALMPGCAAATATNTNGCSLAAGIQNGTYNIKIPINVDVPGQSANAGSNTVSLALNNANLVCDQSNTVGYGGCSARTVDIHVIKAVNQSINITANQSGMYAVNNNDISKSASLIYSLGSGSTCNATISTFGAVSYGSLASSSSCTVNYKLCDMYQGPQNLVCDSGVLTISAPVFPINVNVSGLPAGATTTLHNYGVDALVVSANGVATFSNRVFGAYQVTVLAQSNSNPKAFCTLTNGVGVAAAPVTNINVTCFGSQFQTVLNPSGGSYLKTECVKDMVTGKIWEGKSTSGPRSANDLFTNYDSTTSAQILGVPPTMPTQAHLNLSTNSVAYVAMVNQQGLCGFNDWRLPSIGELSALAANLGGFNSTAMNTWFPDIVSAAGLLTVEQYTSSTSAGTSYQASSYDFRYNRADKDFRTSPIRVRLVR
jgi:Protein of unknown function (DUF1566)